MTGYSEVEPLYDQMGISILLGDLVRLVLASAPVGRKERWARAIRQGKRRPRRWVSPRRQRERSPRDCPQAAGSIAEKLLPLQRGAHQPHLRITNQASRSS